MNSAIEQIVSAYVALGNLQALQDLKQHREALAGIVRDRADFNFAVLLGQIDDDIAAIDAGLDRLRSRTEPLDE
ncbi:hypothetical protein [Tardiphaga sp.]|uniref:hypothetical protein n=1 Tax=Tardiphaga sp. TaxID=1926292 RepID=UPI00261E4FA3|nr:hypothetical protein [Tardiphaga sp.]MDB5617796.1 hypothetical protein [Tardiphaga sp.]